jgi:hypothetical protein
MQGIPAVETHNVQDSAASTSLRSAQRGGLLSDELVNPQNVASLYGLEKHAKENFV